MSKLEAVLNELSALPKEGIDILGDEKYQKQRNLLALTYESWYSRALSAIRQVSPERLDDFVSLYRMEKRKEIQASTYTISDYLRGITVTQMGEEIFSSVGVYHSKFMQQISIVQATAKLAQSTLRDIRTELQLELLDKDLSAARELRKAKHLRSAGVVCGVIIEAHLQGVATRRKLSLTKKSPTISDLNDALKNAGVYDLPVRRLLQRLGDIRNLCCHNKERDPLADEVDDLISGTDKILKEVT